MTIAASIVNTQDESLSVLGGKDEQGRVRIHVRIGEDGMGWNQSRSIDFKLDRAQTQKMIKALQRALSA